MKDLSYTRIFPTRTLISHKDALKESIKSKLTWIMMEENHISEKSHSGTSKVMETIKDGFTDEMLDFSLNEYSSGKRIDYISEILYDKYFKNIVLESNVFNNKGYDKINETKMNHIIKFNESKEFHPSEELEDSMQKFLKLAIKFGHSCSSEQSHGGVSDRTSASEFMEHYGKMISDINDEFTDLKYLIKSELDN